MARDALERLRLIRSRRVGAVTFHRLVEEHGSAAAALSALPEVARAAGVQDYSPCPVEVAEHEMRQARIAGATMLCHGDAAYPPLLAQLPDAPPVLWARGDAALLSRPMVAMVGARNASSLGLRMAKRLAVTLGEGGQVVASGLARGIDAEAHLAALDGGTVAVMAGGVDVVYPEENAHLAAAIAERGCLVSEQPMGLQPQARHFPQRNRVVAGLSRAVVVVEAAARSGSLITAREALELGREVMAVPGHPFDARAAGCNMLIRDGATLVRGAADVLEALGVQQQRNFGDEVDARPPLARPLPGPVPVARPLSQLAELHGQILARLGPSPMAEDQLIRDLALPAAQVAPELVALELDGAITRQAGGLLARSV
ncbi:DNA-processing protein DprA [Paragemmobacter straminiformis]|uniref:DNA-protecting protein DprA n=1 Tax=Paragemmobacter straminiformis TaxID=2045119 RepID=A0A842I4K2_9RHOB|nr:DNA-processing protein DprA [Gemmobacter straminiformis]MBC2834343.1 DNA-protecting protein DprA [Gemmobacter straminiformis]